ncbi:MAG: hypothetical protein VKI83_01690 [Synechococcaceae cyanobacterium]|nr:hypothetical protein [Synechococcaceae cyanobacterium]
MTACEGALQRLVLASCGDPAAVGRLVAAAAPALASALQLPLRHPDAPEDAVACLGRLAPMPAAPSGCSTDVADSDHGRWLLALPVDPGLALGAGGHWAESLGAWRLPVLLLLSPPHLACGWPAAADALLRRWHVPVAGLLQWGGSWDAASRRRDGLPWLGRAEGPGEELEAALFRLQRRWHDLAGL